MKRMIWSFGLVAGGALMAGALWWVLLANGQEAAISAWFDDRRDAGWQAEHGVIEVTGFPLALDRRIADVALADPGAGWSWQLPEVALTGTTFAPTVVDLHLPPAHQLAVPGERVEINHASLSARAALVPDEGLEWQDGGLTAEKLTAAAQSGWTASAGTFELALKKREPDAAPPNSYTLGIAAQSVVLPLPFMQKIDPTGLLQPEMQELTIRGTAAFAAPLDRYALEDGELALQAATLRTVRLDWGDLRLVARGRFDVDPAGYPAGEIDLTLVNWRQMLVIAREARVLDPSLIDAAEQALEFIARLRGEADRIDVPLGLSGGKIRIGPIAIADAPRLAPPR